MSSLLALMVGGCSLGRVRQAPGTGPGSGNRIDPALSGDGRLLASVLERDGRARLILQDQPGGNLRPLRLRRREPHQSPALSWTGRYVAVLVQEGERRRVVIEDRLRGRLLRLPLQAGSQPERISLAADGSRLAVQMLRQGERRVQVFDLSGLLERDLPAGTAVQGGGPPP
ncbi:Tol biopolymer transporter periplasmic protein [Cyanobium sp. CH-040]|uniref:Tol biopolymer transporter periplasmic protein n=1 Tax=Cyanobium sp. CH-040 TaxID=2823708 RepID=UPI0020CE7F3F|nr:Tol biopolymer transporter periplasmic protein [Cyanobium sp. CH-040]